MAEDERELTKEDAPPEATDTEVADKEDADSAANRSTAAESPSEDVDRAAESFVQVEQEFDGLTEGMEVRGQAIDVEQVPADEVPAEYPAEIATDDALAIEFELDGTTGKTATIYFEWREEGTDERLAKLLALRDVPIDRFADLHGERILLTVEDGHYVPVLPKEEPRGDPRGIYGILAGMGLYLFTAAVLLFNLGTLVSSGAFVLLWLFVTFVVLPISTYLDAWNLRTTTNWDGGPLFWAFLAGFPGLNIVPVALYLLSRGNAEPIL